MTIFIFAATLDYGFDELGAFNHLSHNGQLVADIQRNQHGQEIRRTLGNQLQTEYKYDPQGRLIAQRTGKRDADRKFATVSHRRLRYNQQGLLAQIDDQIRGRTRYHYDPLDRLTRVDDPNPEQFIHDPAGNILATNTPDS